MRRWVGCLVVIMVLFATPAKASSLIEERLAEIKDVRLLVSVGGRLNPPAGANPDLLQSWIKEECCSRLREGGISVSDSSSKALVVSVGIDKGRQEESGRWIAVSIRIGIEETLWEKVPPRDVVATTWQMEDLLVLKEGAFESSVHRSISSLIEELCGLVDQARAYVAEMESRQPGANKVGD